MSQPVIFFLLAFALVLPIVGAAALRLLGSRLTPIQLIGAAAGLFGIAVISVVLLARSNVPSLQVGGLSILLPITAPEDGDVTVPQPAGEPPPDVSPVPSALAAPSAAPATATAAPSAVATAAPSVAPTAVAPTAEPTAAPTETPTLEPTAAPTEAPAAPTRRTYTVQPGDTLRSIAEQFGVSVTALVDANNLTPEQADSLRVGEELVIP